MTYETRVRIEAPPERIWAVLADVAAWPRWTASMREVTPLSGAALAAGARVRIRQPRLPAAEWEVTRWAPGRGFTWVSRNPGLTVTADHLLDPAPDGATTLTLALRHRGPLAPVLRLLTGALTRRYLALEAAGLRRAAEQGPG
ncbi:hypothetical protein GCM10010124_35140 [Pilimelia terevasa]|uniref:Polyketide cyclase n=1 Tax=Pilimelia terevasa TaxID=53372 RepID=A0A8J3BRC0_9ACTN|nr:SRPBCC family protein [Pilimelia terevasa]GGK39386.1 hypothetical protein GCM10010124_35140 [Pilimelia terevasa]